MNDYEYEFISILFNHPELIKTTVVKADYFEKKVLGKIFDILDQTGTFDPTEFVSHGFNDVELLMNIYNSFIFETAYQNVFKKDEIKILNHYKTGLLNILNLKLAKRDIDYSEFKEEFDKINEIRPMTVKEHLTKREIIEIISKDEKYISLGKFKRLEKVLRIETDDLVTIAGAPGFGKSAFMLNLFNEMIANDNNYCQYYNLEINKNQVIKRLISIDSKDKIIDITRFNDKENIKKSINKLSNQSYYMSSESYTWEKLQADIICHIKKDKQNIVFIDYLGLIGLENRNFNRSNYDRVTYIMKEIRKLCRRYNVLIFIISQCDRGSLKNDKMTLYSLKDSGEVENSSTHVILIYEDKSEKPDFGFCKNVVFDVAKNRNNYIYSIKATFIGNKMLFEERKSK